jgi:hypothetical protein
MHPKSKTLRRRQKRELLIEKQRSRERTQIASIFAKLIIQSMAIAVVGYVAVNATDVANTLLGGGGIAGLIYAFRKC